MSVYVDNMRAPFGRMVMCHMMADTTEELLTMADKIGVNRKWIQNHGTPREHFDIALTKRSLAIANGAIDADKYDIVNVMRRKQGRPEQERPEWANKP